MVLLGSPSVGLCPLQRSDEAECASRPNLREPLLNRFHLLRSQPGSKLWANLRVDVVSPHQMVENCAKRGGDGRLRVGDRIHSLPEVMAARPILVSIGKVRYKDSETLQAALRPRTEPNIPVPLRNPAAATSHRRVGRMRARAVSTMVEEAALCELRSGIQRSTIWRSNRSIV